MNPEQRFVNALKQETDETLIRKVKELELSTWNKERELNMIHNILINRGYDIAGMKPAVVPYKFMPNTPEENEKYMPDTPEENKKHYLL